MQIMMPPNYQESREALPEHIENETLDSLIRRDSYATITSSVGGTATVTVGVRKPGDILTTINGQTFIIVDFKQDNSSDSSQLGKSA